MMSQVVEEVEVEEVAKFHYLSRSCRMADQNLGSWGLILKGLILKGLILKGLILKGLILKGLILKGSSRSRTKKKSRTRKIALVIR